MKITVISTAVALSLGLAGTASAQSWTQNNYGQINLGSGVAGRTNLDVTGPGVSASDHEHLKAGFFGSALVGHDFGNGLSLEGEGYFGDNDIRTGALDAALGSRLDARVRSYGALANVKLEAPKPYAVGGLKIAPYAAAGVGYGGVKYRVAGASDTDGGLNWQLKAGLAIHTNSNLTWDLGYRYLTTAKYSADDGAGDRVEARSHINAVTAGARFNF
jgi:opacity protein-like surface antigen